MNPWKSRGTNAPRLVALIQAADSHDKDVLARQVAYIDQKGYWIYLMIYRDNKPHVCL